MNEHQSALWQKLASFSIDEPGSSFTFEAKLARENRWSLSYTRRAIEEYRRFVFLCVEAGHPCSPSSTVDAVWHLHLTYTRSYWNRLCGEILGGPLHHDPTTGGPDETAKFDEWRRKTLESYGRIFGERPPEDIWQDSVTRAKPLFRHSLTPVVVVLLATGLLSCGGSMSLLGPLFAAVLVLFAIIIAIGSFAAAKRAGDRGQPYIGSSGCGGDTSDSSDGGGCGSSCGGGCGGGD